MTGLISAVRGIGCAFALCSMVLPAVSHAQQTTPQRGGTLVMVVQPEPPTLASYQSTARPVGQVATKVYEGLLEYDFNLKPIPGLAQVVDGERPTARPSPSSCSEGVKFHDGQPFTSADVKFTYHGRTEEAPSARHQHLPRGRGDRHARSAHRGVPALRAGAVHADGAVGLRIADDPEAHLRHRRHRQPSQRQQADRHRAVQVRRVAEGPVHAVRPQPDYWKKGRPYLDRIVARFIADGSTRAATLETREAQIAGFSAVLPLDVKRLQALPHIARHHQRLRDAVADRRARLQHARRSRSTTSRCARRSPTRSTASS